MATEADIRLALEGHADRLADGAAHALVSLWRGELATADTSILPELIGARLVNPFYAGFTKQPPASPPIYPTPPKDQAQANETPDDQVTTQHRARLARNGANWLSSHSASPENIAKAKAEDQQAIAQAQSTAPPWLKPGMSPNEALVAAHDHGRKNNGAMWLRGR